MSRPDQHPHAFGVPSMNTSAPALLSTTPSVESPVAMTAVAEDAIREVSVNMQKSATFSGRIERDFRRMAAHVATMQSAHQKIAKDSIAAVRQASDVVEGRPVGGIARAASTAVDGHSGASRRVAGTRPIGHTGHVRSPEEAAARDPFVPTGAPADMPHTGTPEPRDPAMRDLSSVDKIKQAAVSRVNSTLQSHFLASRPMPAEGTEEHARWLRSQARVGRAQGAVEALGGGEGLAGAGKMLLGRFAGPVGLALTGIQQGISQAENQRTQNLFYQQATGGSNFSGFAQRMHENVFAWSQSGGLGSEQAREAFRGMTELDPTGRTRQQGLNFIQDEYKNLGMTVQDSLKLISTSIQAGVKDFGVMKSAIDTVSASARQGGINVQEAQQRFSGQVAVTASRMGGLAAIQNTSALAAAFNRNGEQMAGIDFTGMTGDDAIRRMAAQQGMTNEQFRERMDSDPLFLARAQQHSLNSSMRDVVGPQGSQRIQQELMKMEQANAAKGIKGTTAKQREELAARLSTILGSGYDRRRVIQSAARAGLQLNTKTANQAVVDALGGTLNIEGEAQQEQQSHEIVQGAVTTDDAIAKGGYKMDAQSARDAQLQEMLTTMGWGGQMDHLPDEVQAYVDIVKRTGNRDKNLENTLLKAGVFDKDKKFGVTVAGGKQRKVGIKDIVERFSDQYNKGEIQVYKGDEALGTVTETMSHTSLNEGRSQFLGAGAVDDSSTAKWKTKFGDDIKGAGENNGTVAITVKAPYDRWFGFEATGPAISPNQRADGAPATTLESRPADSYQSADPNNPVRAN